MAENERWNEDRDERSARDDTAWRAGDRYPPNNPDAEARRGYMRDEERRAYGAGDYERDYAGREDLRYGGPAYASDAGRGQWPAYDPGRDSSASRDRGGVDWRAEHGRSGRRDDWRARPDQNEPMWARREDRRENFAHPSHHDERSPWLGREPDEADRDRRGPGEERSFWDRTRDELANFFGTGGGEHRGKGPRGYRRSDERIREDVNDRLTDDSWVDASEVEVRVQGGEVTLDGRVRTRDDKRRAEDIAERVSGVSHVQNNLRVTEPRESARYGARNSQPY
jgi:hypothetical protein